jgi:DNA-binding GntR family transcriptional regulator
MVLSAFTGDERLRKIKTVRDLKGEVYKSIKEAIISRRLAPGSPLKEADLVEKLGVSRTPIREALNQLFKEGMVEIYPRQGSFVKNWTKDDVIEVLILREVLEGVAARIATKRLQEESIRALEGYFRDYRNGLIDYAQADSKFHNDIILASGSSRLFTLVNNLMDSLQMMDMRAVSFRYPERINESLAEHLRIIDAFKAKDEMLAEQLTREHFRRTLSFYEKHLESR